MINRQTIDGCVTDILVPPLPQPEVPVATNAEGTTAEDVADVIVEAAEEAAGETITTPVDQADPAPAPVTATEAPAVTEEDAGQREVPNKGFRIVDHGGVYTAMDVVKVEYTKDIDLVINALQAMRDNGKGLDGLVSVAANGVAPEIQSYIVRDNNGGSHVTILPDGVYKLTLDRIREVKLDDVHQNILEFQSRTKDSKTTILNCPFPVLAFSEAPARKSVVCKITDGQTTYRSGRLHIAGIPIKLPTCVIRVYFTDKNAFVGARIAAVIEENRKLDRYKLGHMFLPNIYNHCNICTGTMTQQWESPDDAVIGETIALFWSTFLGSDWNMDLIKRDMAPTNLEAIFLSLYGDVNSVDEAGKPKMVAKLTYDAMQPFMASGYNAKDIQNNYGSNSPVDELFRYLLVLNKGAAGLLEYRPILPGHQKDMLV